jgi:hypothetical protein
LIVKIYLSGLPEQADPDRLRERMSHFATVEEVHVLREYMGDDRAPGGRDGRRPMHGNRDRPAHRRHLGRSLHPDGVTAA